MMAQPQQRQRPWHDSFLDWLYGDTREQRPDQSNWDVGIARTQHGLGKIVGLTPLFAGINWLNSTPADRGATAPAPAPVTGDVFGFSNAAPHSAPRQPDRYDINRALQGAVASAFPNAVFSGGAGQVRDPADYDRLRRQGAPAVRNSRHETGEATDFNIPGMGANDIPQVAAALRARGLQFEDLLYHNNHFHLELPRGGGQSLTGRVLQEGSDLGRQIFDSIDPLTAAALVPDPIMLRGVTLPDAPQRALPADLPQHEVVSRAILDELRAASQIPERDRSQDAWDKFQALLAGAAAGAVQAGDMTLGGQIAAAGAGGLNEFRGEREGQRALDREQDMMQRQLNIALAQAGIDVDMQALTGRNANLDRGWQSGENRADTVFSNDTARFNRDLQQANTDLGVQQYNTGAVNQARSQRGQAALGALEGGVNARNQGTQLGIQLAASAAERQTDPRQADLTIKSALATAGVPENSATIGVARAISARNPNAAMPYLAQSVLSSGLWESMLPQEDVAQVQRYMRNEDTAPMALAIVQRALAATAQEPDGKAVIEGLVDDLQAQGDPVGILLRNARAE